MATYRDIKLNAIDEDLEDIPYINQICKLAVAVPVGSLPLVEGFGSTISGLLDAPLNAPTIASAQSGCFEALDGLVDDVEVVSVTVSKDANHKLTIKPKVQYRGVVL